MKLHSILLAVSLGGLIPFAAGAAPRSAVGSVRAVDGTHLRVCFKDTAPPAVGSALELQRGHIPFKSSGPMLYQTFGHARVAAVEDACVIAELTGGSARRFDRVQAADPQPLPPCGPSPRSGDGAAEDTRRLIPVALVPSPDFRACH